MEAEQVGQMSRTNATVGFAAEQCYRGYLCMLPKQWVYGYHKGKERTE